MNSLEANASAWVDVGRVEDFPAGRGRRVMVAGCPVALFHVAGRFHALLDCCTHAQAALSGGTVQGGEVVCPRHGAHFDLRSGEVRTLQAVRNVETFAVAVEQGRVFVHPEPRLAPPLWASGRHLGAGPAEGATAGGQPPPLPPDDSLPHGVTTLPGC